MNDFTSPVSYRAAMFKAVGRQAKLSRSGYSVVFAAPQEGRSDLSGDPRIAANQLRAAGIDLAAVTAADIVNYEQWHDALYQARRIGQARVLITRKFGMERRNEIVASNRVTLIDGWGIPVSGSVIVCVEVWELDTLNRIGEKGAFASYPDYPRINAAIAEMRAEFKEFAHAPVTDNNVSAQ